MTHLQWKRIMLPFKIFAILRHVYGGMKGKVSMPSRQTLAIFCVPVKWFFYTYYLQKAVYLYLWLFPSVWQWRKIFINYYYFGTLDPNIQSFICQHSPILIHSIHQLYWLSSLDSIHSIAKIVLTPLPKYIITTFIQKLLFHS